MKRKMLKELELTPLTAITTIDGRYRERVWELASVVSEFGLIKTRFKIEAKYLIALSDIGVVRRLNSQERKKLDSLGQEISLEDALKVKTIEEETRHDVKAVERAFRHFLKRTSLEDLTEFIHLGLTSEDINNLAYRLMLKGATQEVLIPNLEIIVDDLVDWANRYKAKPMLARTHGQPAVTTTLGKEMVNFAFRLNEEVIKLSNQKLNGKLNGAVGNFNALTTAYPHVDWIKFSKSFVTSLGLKPNLITTQINPYEDIIEFFQNIQRINGIIIDLDQDIWRYISDDWFSQVAKEGEVGSSTMTQKVNPIDFENSEGNLELANGILETLSRKLSRSRLQRDLSDSTTIRNIGTTLGFALVGYKSVATGFARIVPNLEKISVQLNSNWAILGEAVQTLLRSQNVKDPYSLVSSFTRGAQIDQAKWKSFVDDLPIDEGHKGLIRGLTPEKYIGQAVVLTKIAIKAIKDTRNEI